MKIAINGFGRIGRLAFRKLIDDPDMEVVAINDLTDNKTLAHLLKYDTSQKKIKKNVTYDDKSIKVDGKKILSYAEADPEKLPWKELNIDVVIECTGFFTSKEKANKHIEAGAKKVVISAPAEGVKTIVYNVNHETIEKEDNIISAASCTTNCLAPVAKVINDNYKITSGFMSTVHAYTNDQNTLDAPHRKGDLRRARAAAENIVPNTTGAAKAIGKVIPELEGKLDGTALRVPVAAGSIIELICNIEKNTTIDEVNELMKNNKSETLGYNDEEIVSSDIIGIECGSLFDATLTKVLSNKMIKVSAWYDNEMSYTCQMIRTVKYLQKYL